MDTFSLIMLIISTIITLALYFYIQKNNFKNTITNVFSINLILIFIWLVPLICQILFAKSLNINPIFFDYIAYIGICFLPISIFFTSSVFSNTKIEFKKRHLLLFVVPAISLLVLWTNNYHHLFYRVYSTDLSKTITGPYTIVHYIYTYGLFVISIINLLRYSIKNAGFFF